MSRSAKMRVRKTDYRSVVVLITRAIFIGVLIVFAVDVMRLLIGVWRKLNRAERNRRTRISVAHLLCADQRVDETDRINILLTAGQKVREKQNKGGGYFLH